MSLFATQEAINIAGIKDGVVILKNGGYRIIMSVSTVNFALKSEQEQNALIFQYQSFLNSLHFPIEVVMRSARLDLSPYLQKIKGLAKKQDNELLRIQTEDYVDFVGQLINLANIMKKTFYVAVPFQPVTLQGGSFISKLFNKEKTFTELRITEDEFKRNSEELRQRANVVASGLGGMGLRCVQLTTEEIIELFYQIYNPEIAGKERITEAESLSSPVVQHISEKRDENKEGENETEEKVIDNSSEVIAHQKEQSMLRQQEMMKEGERQVAMTQPAQPKAPEPQTDKKEDGVGETKEAESDMENSQDPPSAATTQPDQSAAQSPPPSNQQLNP
ncbi:MAG: hypothetical protein BWY68_00244 [bacterium ADurb.Bin400]|nr:MAG: hypothetical protein BWY68_00244 [bacterium ADurb.Bin400]